MATRRDSESTQLSNCRAVIYTRVSSKEQEKGGFSIPAQSKLLNAYAEEHGFSIVQEYTDVETAKKAGRTSFNEMISYLKKQQSSKQPGQPCRVILVEKTDRLYRNLKDWVTLDELDLEVHLVKDGVILSKDSRSNEKFMHGIKVLMAKNYIDNLSEETKKGMVEKAEQGIFPSYAPLGYLNVECDGKRYIQPDPQLAPMIQKIYEWYATGQYSVKDVAQLAYEEGFAYRRTKGRVHKSIVHKILSSPVYYGDFVWGGKRYHGIHEPLVSREMWDKVQDIKTDKGNRKTRHQKHDWAFRGLVSCGHCGCALTAEIKKGQYVYYHCTGQKGKCPEKYVREEVLAEQFGEALKAIRLECDVLEWVVQALKSGHEDEKRYHNEMMATLHREYTKLQNRIDQMYVDKLDGNITQEFYDQKSNEWRKEQVATRRKIEKHENANCCYIEEGIRILELANRAWELYENQEMAEKRRLLDYVFSNSTWADGKLTPNYKKPFDLILEACKLAAERQRTGGGGFDKTAKNEIWLPDKGSNLGPTDPESVALPTELSGSVIIQYPFGSKKSMVFP